MPPGLRGSPQQLKGRVRAPESPQRKTFQCIVDDTALIDGVKRSTRDGIRKWVTQGAIHLYVPLHTLKQLERIKHGNDRAGADARDAIKWLDDITSLPAIVASGNVQLEGVDEEYTTWDEVERFLLPETLLSLENADADIEYEDDLDESLAHLDVSDESSMSSSHSLEDPPKTPQSAVSTFSVAGPNKSLETPFNPKAAALMMKSPDRTARNSAELLRIDKQRKHVVPDYLKSLFNHILWRINKERNPDAALETFILLTNDDTKQTIARKFGIRVKRLDQMRDAIGHEDREYKNRLAYMKMEAEDRKPRNLISTREKAVPLRDTSSDSKNDSEDDATRDQESVTEFAAPPESNHSRSEIESDREDEVLLKRAPRGPQAQMSNGTKLWEPRGPKDLNQRGGRGGRGGRGHRGGHSGRGRGMFPRGRGGFVPRGAYAPPASQFRASPGPRTIDPNQPIDPDSFARPTIRGTSTRGSNRKLWEPN